MGLQIGYYNHDYYYEKKIARELLVLENSNPRASIKMHVD